MHYSRDMNKNTETNQTIVLAGMYPCGDHNFVDHGNTAMCTTHLCSAVRMSV